MLQIQLLGPLDVRDGERVLEIRRRKQRALLAVLALHAGEALSPDRLVEDIWGESPPKTARHALENYVSELRRTLGREVIRTEPAGYVLAVAPEQVDARRLEGLLERTDETPADRASRLRGELSAIRGQPLEDLAFEPFALEAAPRLQELELAAREELLGIELELGRHTDVVIPLERLVAAHPYREHLRVLLMLALYQAGRQADALAVYQDARRVLVEELGIDPGEELQELERAILRQDPSLKAPPRVTGRHAAAAGDVPRRPTRKTVTAVVARLSNAAELADRLEPEVLRAFLDRYANRVSSAVERHGGIARSESGRALAVFGVPTANEDDALRAVRAATEIREGVGVLNDGLLPEHGVFLEVRAAIDTGEALVTPDDAEIATGRPITGADEVERSARPGQILLSEATFALVRDAVVVEAAAAGNYRLVELLADVHGRALRLDSPFVGRRRQLASLSSAFESVVTDRAFHLFTVLGVAGAGKSRLVREFLDGVDGVAAVLRGQCLPYGEAAAFWPLADVLRDADSDAVTAAGVRAALEHRAEERPVVLVIDDLQWADPSLLDLLDEVTRTSRGARILMLCIARPDLFDERPSWGGGSVNASSVLLESMTEAESERLLDNLLGDSDLPDSVRDYIVSTSEGNPLFVEELLATLVDHEILQRKEGQWRTTQVPVIPLPSTIQALVSARIDRLPEAERIVLELASVEGKVFRMSVVAGLAGDTPGVDVDVDVCLAGLVRKELVREQPRVDGRYEFRHQLIREAAYESMPLPVRAELHERLSQFFAGPVHSSGESDEPVAYHRDRARRYRVALGEL